jgi:hypothetical protein
MRNQYYATLQRGFSDPFQITAPKGDSTSVPTSSEDTSIRLFPTRIVVPIDFSPIPKGGNPYDGICEREERA